MLSRDEIIAYARRTGRGDAAGLRSRAPDMDGTALIREEQKVPDFDPKRDYSAWPAGAPVADGGQVYKLIQPHNAADYEGRPATLRALWGLCHTMDPDRAKPFAAPLGTSGLYMDGECVADGGKVYRCRKDNTVYSPAELPEAWEEV